jgi:hypothetical protein
MIILILILSKKLCFFSDRTEYFKKLFKPKIKKNIEQLSTPLNEQQYNSKEINL